MRVVTPVLVTGATLTVLAAVALCSAIFMGTSATGPYLQIINCMHRHLVHGNESGSSRGGNNGIEEANLLPGDTLIGYKPGSAYGHYSHVTMYLGNGRVYGCNSHDGFYLSSLARFAAYDEVVVLSPPLHGNQREEMVRWVKAQLGRPFFIGADREDECYVSCASLAWQAWQKYSLFPQGESYGPLSPDELMQFLAAHKSQTFSKGR